MNVQKQIEDKLQQAFFSDYLSVENESYMHQVPPDSETHFKVVVVSAEFEGKLPVKRHQAVYKVLCAEVKQIHALALHTFTPQEWEKCEGTKASPACAHARTEV